MHRICIHMHKRISCEKTRKRKSLSKSGYPIYKQEGINYRARKTRRTAWCEMSDAKRHAASSAATLIDFLVHVSWQRSWLNQPSASVWCIYAFQFARRTCCTLHRVIHWQEYGKYVKKSVRDTQWSALIAIKDKAIKDKVVLSKALPMAKYFLRQSNEISTVSFDAKSRRR